MARYFQYDYTTHTGTEYARSGECNQCGECCAAMIRFAYQNANQEGVAWEERSVGGPCTDGEGTWTGYSDGEEILYHKVLEITPRTQPCRSLTPDNTCAIYTKRNLYCQSWPFAPSDTAQFPNCSYEFTKIDEWSF